jgi:hypothetical protein
VKKILFVLLIVFVVLLVIGVGAFLYADTRVKAYAEQEAQKRIATRVPQADGVNVTIDGFPLLFDILFGGKIEGLHVEIARVHSHGIEAKDLSLDVEGIALDRDKMLSDRQLIVTGIDRATVQGFLSDDDVSKAAKAKVTFKPGKVTVSAHGHTVDAKVRIVGRRIELRANMPGVPKATVPLPEQELLPCKPEVEVQAGRLRLSCSIDELPDAVKRAMGTA